VAIRQVKAEEGLKICKVFQPFSFGLPVKTMFVNTVKPSPEYLLLRASGTFCAF